MGAGVGDAEVLLDIATTGCRMTHSIQRGTTTIPMVVEVLMAGIAREAVDMAVDEVEAEEAVMVDHKTTTVLNRTSMARKTMVDTEAAGEEAEARTNTRRATVLHRRITMADMALVVEVEGGTHPPEEVAAEEEAEAIPTLLSDILHLQLRAMEATVAMAVRHHHHQLAVGTEVMGVRPLR